jgi:alanyl-tRNA synthetase
VIDVSEEDGRVIHWVEEPCPKGRIRGKIDWSRRFDHMQQHAGQHILSQSFYELYQAETLSFHLGEQVSSVEIDLRKADEELVHHVEERANQIVFEDRRIKTYFIPREKLNQVPLRKPPKKEGLIRVVEVDGFDYSACGGTHPHHTGEVGLIKIIRWERIRQNIRFEFVCGYRALKDYQLRNVIIRYLVSRLNVKPAEIGEAMDKLSSQLKQLRKKLKSMSQELSCFQAREITRQAETHFISLLFDDKSSEEVKFLALQIIKSGPYVVLLGTKIENKIHLVVATAEELNLNLRDIQTLVAEIIQGKGGGSPSLLEFRGEKPENFSLLGKKIKEYLAQQEPDVLKKKIRANLT